MAPTLHIVTLCFVLGALLQGGDAAKLQKRYEAKLVNNLLRRLLDSVKRGEQGAASTKRQTNFSDWEKSTPDDECHHITLTQDGVAADPSGLVDESTPVEHFEEQMWVKLKFSAITKVELVTPVAGSKCSGLVTDYGRPGYGYGVYDASSVFVDLGCQAELKVCGNYITAPPTKGSDQVCSLITLTKDGVASDPSGLVDESADIDWFEEWMMVPLKFSHIDHVDLVKPVAGSECMYLTNPYGNVGRGYGKYDDIGVFTDLGCQAELRVCGNF